MLGHSEVSTIANTIVKTKTKILMKSVQTIRPVIFPLLKDRFVKFYLLKPKVTKIYNFLKEIAFLFKSSACVLSAAQY